MKLPLKQQYITTSVVVTATNIQPAVLNPDFLLRREIVKESWGWEVFRAASTPKISVVLYKNAASVQMDSKRIQVQLSAESGDQSGELIHIASALLRICGADMGVSAIGLNFKAYSRTTQPEEELRARFFAPGSLTSAIATVQPLGMKLTCPLQTTGKYNLSLDAGEVETATSDGEKESFQAVLSNGNCHFPIMDIKHAIDILQHLNDHLALHEKYFNWIVNGEEAPS